MRKINNKERIGLNDKMGDKAIEVIRERFGHIESSQMIALLTKQFYFKNMHRKIIKHFISCKICVKKPKQEESGLWKNGRNRSPFEMLVVSMDTIGGFGGRRSTKKYCQSADDATRPIQYFFILVGQHHNLLYNNLSLDLIKFSFDPINLRKCHHLSTIFIPLEIK